MNALEIVRASDFGLFLDGGDLGDILLPKRYRREEWKPGDTIDVFIMLDSEDRLTAITQKPLAMVGEFAHLRVASITQVGAFLDWGLPKDLFVPFREQKVKMRKGESYIVYIYLDQASGRIAASSKLDKFLTQTEADYAPREKVALLICDKTDLGYKAVINGAHGGILYHNEVFQPLKRGQHIDGFIKQIRPDGKIDLYLQKPGFKKVIPLTQVILDYIKEQGGFMPITGKTPPEEIYALFNVSKKTFKRAISTLYKKRLISIEEKGIRMNNQSSE